MKLDFSKENWVVDPAVQTAMGGERIFKVVQARGGLIADVSAWWVSKEAAQANAQLIAASPKLFTALQQIERLSRDADGSKVDVRAMLGDIARAAVVGVGL